MTVSGNFAIVETPGWSFKAMTVLTLTTGTAFIMWLGEQITERGVGNGMSLLIFAGIVVGFPGFVSPVRHRAPTHASRKVDTALSAAGSVTCARRRLRVSTRVDTSLTSKAPRRRPTESPTA